MQERPDAAGMRNGAAQLRAKADRVAAMLTRLETQVGAMTYTGPAADRFRRDMATRSQVSRETIRILGTAADLLNQGAAAVDADPTGFYGAGGRV
jgi:uncharacterized protein YukE